MELNTNSNAIVCWEKQPVVKLEPCYLPEDALNSNNSTVCSEKQPETSEKNNSNSDKVDLFLKQKDQSGSALKSLLNSIPEGRALLLQYSRLKMLTNEDRSHLADIVIGHEFSKRIIKSLSEKRMEELVQQIIITFPSEKTVDWFQFVKYYNGTKIVLEGKFIQRYNTWRFVTKCGPIQGCSMFEISQTVEAGENDVIEVSLAYLRIASSPKAVIEDLWKKTMKRRHTDFSTYKENLYNYFKKFPCLREPLGLTLLEKDFQFLYPEVNFNLFAEWPKLSTFIESVLRLHDPKFLDGDIPHETRMMKLLMNLSQIFPSIPVKQDPSIGTWWPSKDESQASFFLVIESIQDLQPIIDRRSETLQKYGLSLQPLPVIIGSAEKFLQCFIILDTATYEVDNPLKAVDLTFKIFHALHLNYPPECAQIWTFLQTAVYKIDNDSSKKFPDMSELICNYMDYHLPTVHSSMLHQ